MKYTKTQSNHGLQGALRSPSDTEMSLATVTHKERQSVSQRRLLLLFYVGPLLLWMAVIFFSSTGAGRGENSFRLLRGLLAIISPEQARTISPHTLEILHIVARKLAHVTEYAILTMLAVRAIQFGESKLKKSALFGAFLISALYACSDEIHQRFVPGRGASPIDVAIDLSGVVLVMVGIVLWFGVKSLERNLLRRPATND